MPTSSGFVRPDDALGVRNAVLGKLCNTSDAKTDRNIFISRRGTKARAIPDQDRLEQKFLDDGYELLQLENMSWTDQVNAFASASTIAGLHGAGFANIIFAPCTCSVHEIFPPSYRNDCYARLAETFGMDYQYIVAGE